MMEARFPYMVEAHFFHIVKMAKDLDITLDDSAGLCKWILIDGWM